VLFVFKLLEHISRGSPQRETIINEVGNVGREGQRVDNKKQVLEYLPVIKIKPEIERQDHQQNKQCIEIQDSAEIESDAARFKAEKISEGHFRKERSIEKVKSNPANSEHEHDQGELKCKRDIDIMPVGQTLKKMIRFQDGSFVRRRK
jgi:hypothetical protein